jgi:hypothetical protein
MGQVKDRGSGGCVGACEVALLRLFSKKTRAQRKRGARARVFLCAPLFSSVRVQITGSQRSQYRLSIARYISQLSSLLTARKTASIAARLFFARARTPLNPSKRTADLDPCIL